MSDPQYSPEQLQETREEMLAVLANDPKNLDALVDLLCADTMLCEANLRSHGKHWLNFDLCQEIIEHIPPVLRSNDPEVYELGIHVCERAAEALPDHPRLKWKLLKYALDTRVSKGMEQDDELESEVNYLEENVLHADHGEPDKIKTKGTLKHDPIEWSKEYEDVIHQAQEKVYSLLNDAPRGMGFCHAYWHTLQRVLEEDYGIHWRHPAQMNPRVMFD